MLHLVGPLLKGVGKKKGRRARDRLCGQDGSDLLGKKKRRREEEVIWAEA